VVAVSLDNDCYCAVPLIIKFSEPIATRPRYQRRPTVSCQIIQCSAPRVVPSVSSDDESSVLIGAPYAVKDTNGGILTIISETFRDSFKPTGNDVPRMTFCVSPADTGSGTGPFFGYDNENINNEDTNDGDSVDVRIIVEKDLRGHSFAATTVVNAFGTSAEGNIDHWLTNKHSEDVAMLPEKETEEHRVAQLLYTWPSTFAGPHRLPLPNELMKYHPIDRGRFYSIASWHTRLHRSDLSDNGDSASPSMTTYCGTHIHVTALLVLHKVVLTHSNGLNCPSYSSCMSFPRRFSWMSRPRIQATLMPSLSTL
jgi:hypothetical protein